MGVAAAAGLWRRREYVAPSLVLLPLSGALPCEMEARSDVLFSAAAAQEKKRLMEEKRQKAAAVYRERYANAAAAEFVAQQVQSTSFYLLERGAGLPDPGMPNAR